MTILNIFILPTVEQTPNVAPNKLHHVDLRILPIETCHALKREGFFVDDTYVICAGNLAGAKDLCKVHL